VVERLRRRRIQNSEFRIWNACADTKEKHTGLYLGVLCVLCVLCGSGAAVLTTAQIIGSSRTALAIVEDLRTRRPIVDVGADDFVIQEGTASREVLSVRVADYPVVVMIDTAGTPDDLPLVVKAARRFIEHLGAERPVALATSGDRPKLLAAFEADRPELLKQLDEIGPAPSSGGSPLHGAGLAADTLAAMRPLFSAIVMLSANPDRLPGGDDAREESDTVAGIVASGAIVHIIACVAPRTSAAGSIGTATLRALAEQTHGQFVSIYTAASYTAALDQISTRMASELMIEYLVPNESRATEVKLGVRMPGTRVRGLGVAPK
jgi:hypothetical protein